MLSTVRMTTALSLMRRKLLFLSALRRCLRGVIAPSSMTVNKPTVYIFNTYGVDKDDTSEVNKKKIAYYFDAFEDFIERFNSDDNFYPESYINEISIKNAGSRTA